jgi:hypothetical protein
VAAAAAIACSLAFGAGSAPAARTHQVQSTFTSAGFQLPASVAVDQSGGDLYVVDILSRNVQKFDASGQPVEFTALDRNSLEGSQTATGYFEFGGAGDAQVAVDASGGATDGTIYVSSSQNGLEIFEASGAYRGNLRTAGGVPLDGVCGLAVGATGDLYVGSVDGTISRFDPQGGTVADADFEARITGATGSCSMAVDSQGSVYAAGLSRGPLVKYTAADFGAAFPAGTQIVPSAYAVGIDPSNDDVYVSVGTSIRQFARTGEPIGTFGAFQAAYGVAVHGPSGLVYVSDEPSDSVTIFGPTVTVPDVTTAAASGITPVTATVAGTVAPNGTPTTYRFEYGPTTAYGGVAPAQPADAGSGTGVVAVDADLTGLRAETTYHYRLVATNANGSVASTDGTFRTAGLLAQALAPTEITTGSATLHGTVDPRGLPGATFRFVVDGTESSFTTTTPSAPVPAGDGAVPVSAAVDGLPEGSAFTARLVVDTPVAQGSSGTVGFRTVAAPAFVPPPLPSPLARPYGCASPRLNPFAGTVRPGQRIRLTGADLGVGASVVLGRRVTAAESYSADGFVVTVPDDARGTLALTINCGTPSNTIGLPVRRAPSNAINVTASASGRTVRVSVKVPGAGVLRLSGDHLRSVKARVAAARTTKLRMTLSRRGVRALRSASRRRLRVAVDVSFTPTGGDRRTVTRRVTVRRAAK